MNAIMAGIAEGNKISRIVIGGLASFAISAFCSTSINVMNDQTSTLPPAKTTNETVSFSNFLVGMIESFTCFRFTAYTETILTVLSTWGGRLSTSFTKPLHFSLFPNSFVIFPSTFKAFCAFGLAFNWLKLSAYRTQALGFKSIKSFLVSCTRFNSTFLTTYIFSRYAGFTTAHADTFSFKRVIPFSLFCLTSICAGLTCISSRKWRNFTANKAKELSLESQFTFLINTVLLFMTFLTSNMRTCSRFLPTMNTNSLYFKTGALFFSVRHKCILFGV